MGFFSFIENFFFISLGIVFILVLLLVYHFKQRMSSVERKGDTMYELVVNMVKEIRFLRAFYPGKDEVEKVKEEVFTEKAKSVPEVIPGLLNTYSGSAQSTLQQSTNVLASTNVLDPVSYFIREASNKIVVSDDSDTDSTGSDLDSDEESDEESVPLNNIEVEDIQLYLDQIETEPLKNIGVEDVPLDFDDVVEETLEPAVTEETLEPAVTEETLEPAVTEETLEPAVTEETLEPAVTEETLEPAVTEETLEPAVTEESSSDEEPTPVYTADNLRKMNINQLKSIAISSGMTVDTSKMKKNELITLLLKE